ncbi:hypothetical protein WMY93_004622 [Mugilogobius chulae]|uniref:Uncharacterized protein n=1 Tax=Mugilogobius chulae TaxID=88201 RepID=A0AAW0PYX1_9GOBI
MSFSRVHAQVGSSCGAAVCRSPLLRRRRLRVRHPRTLCLQDHVSLVDSLCHRWDDLTGPQPRPQSQCHFSFGWNQAGVRAQSRIDSRQHNLSHLSRLLLHLSNVTITGFPRPDEALINMYNLRGPLSHWCVTTLLVAAFEHAAHGDIFCRPLMSPAAPHSPRLHIQGPDRKTDRRTHRRIIIPASPLDCTAAGPQVSAP